MTSYIPKVERWRDECKAKMVLAHEGTTLYDMLAGHLKMYEELLESMRKCHEPAQKSLMPQEPREPGCEG